MKCTVEGDIKWLEEHKAVIRCGHPHDYWVTIEAEGLTVKGYTLLSAAQTIRAKWFRAQREVQHGESSYQD